MSGAPLYRRREALGVAVGAAVTAGLGVAFWEDLFGGPETSPAPRAPATGYGARRAPDEHGIRLPERFTVRRVALGDEVVPGSGYTWHRASDGGAVFPTGDRGWILVSNSEELRGGAGALRFGPDGEVRDAYRILEGTTANCAGGPTPWGTWLSCEEYGEGRVWECDPAGEKKARVHDAMGVFKHEAAAVDPRRKRVYLTEDIIDGAFYRFTPRRWPDLSDGLLELAKTGSGGAVEWVRVPDPLARREQTRRQVPGYAEFARAEGIWFDSGSVFVATTADSRIHAYDTAAERVRVIYDGLAVRNAPLLRVDNITASRSGELFVCEDISTDEIDIGVITRDRKVSKFLSVTGPKHAGSELTGVAFDPTGGRLYFSSQRAEELRGAVYEVSGPFRS